MGLMELIHQRVVPPGHVVLWWLGQSSFVLKSPAGMIVAIDPYLTNSCGEIAVGSGLSVDRLFPSLILPEHLRVDVIALSHSHQDHCDPKTIEGHKASGGKGPFVATGETMEKLVSLGIAQDDIL